MVLAALNVLAIWMAVSLSVGLAWIAVVLTADAFSALHRSLRRDDVRPVIQAPANPRGSASGNVSHRQQHPSVTVTP